jgi:hypothetical protein
VIDAGVRDYWVRYLARQLAPVYAVLDAARDPGMLHTLRDLGADSLFDDPELADVAPHVVRASDTIVGKAWGRAWGVFAISTRPMSEIRTHFARLLDARTEDGARYLFRFYDPRVLRAVIPVCTPDEVAGLLGPIERFVIEARQPAAGYAVTRAGTTELGVPA